MGLPKSWILKYVTAEQLTKVMWKTQWRSRELCATAEQRRDSFGRDAAFDFWWYALSEAVLWMMPWFLLGISSPPWLPLPITCGGFKHSVVETGVSKAWGGTIWKLPRLSAQSWDSLEFPPYVSAGWDSKLKIPSLPRSDDTAQQMFFKSKFPPFRR